MSQAFNTAIGSRNWFVGTAALSMLAVMGNYFNIHLFFGVSFIFGSIAVILAIALLGSMSGMMVAVVGGLYTISLFGHPYAALIFATEALVVGFLYRRGMCNLVVADVLFWCLLGVPLVLINYQYAMGMSWDAALLIGLKQSLNGIFNTLMASIILLLMTHYLSKNIQWKPINRQIRIQGIFFNVLLTTILLAGVPPIIQQSHILQAEREKAMTIRLMDKAQDLIKGIKNTPNINKAELRALLDEEYFNDSISVAIIGSDDQVLAQQGKMINALDQEGYQALSDNVSIWVPSGDVPKMQRWINARYHVSVPVDKNTLVSAVVLEHLAKPLVESLKKSNIYLFMFITGLLIVGVLISLGVSYLFSRPIKILNDVSKHMAEKINAGATPVFPTSSIEEFESLGVTLRDMSNRLVESFHEQHKVQDGLELQVKQRTRELGDVNIALNDRQLALNQHAIVTITDVAGSIVYANDKFCEISGYSREELLGENHRLIKSDQHPAQFYKNLWSQISQGKTWQGRIANRNKNGELYWVQSTITPFLDNAGKPYQYIAIRTDITGVIASEMALSESEERLALAIEGSGDGVWDWDMPNEAMTFSKQYEAMMGYAEHELPPLVSTWVDSVHPEDLPRVEKRLGDYLAGQFSDYIVELRLSCKDGSYKWIMCRGKVVNTDQAGQPLRMIGIHTDITEQKKSEQALIDSREEADRANRAKSEFLSSMSHELRTPMNAILGFGQLLDMDDELNKEQLQSVQEILKGGDHLLKLINEVLDLSKIESGSIDMSLEPVSLCEIVTECVALIKPLAEKRDIRIHYASLKDIIVRADAIRLKQALLNLLSNAIKYNRDGGQVFIDVALALGNQIRILIKDTGIGVAKESLAGLFEPFNRLGAEGESIEGTGIGLTITQRIVDIMGGTISVESEVGVGSCFSIELPLETQPVENAQMIENQTKSAVDDIIEQQYTILYVEDNPANLKLVSKLLSWRQHIHLLTAHTPELGLELAVAHQPDLILLDINMPSMSGYEVLAHFQLDEQLKTKPVIAVSAEAMPNDIERGLAAGFSHYLTKPINLEKFNATLDEYLSPGN